MIASGTLTEEDRHVIQDSVKRERESASSRPSVESACVSESVLLPVESVVLSVESVVLPVESVTPPIESITPAESVTLPTEHETPLVERVTPFETSLPNENPTLLSSTE